MGAGRQWNKEDTMTTWFRFVVRATFLLSLFIAVPASAESRHEPSDAELARLIQKGDEAERKDSLERLLGRYEQRMARWDPEIRSSVNEKIVLSLERGTFYRGDSSFGTWLFKVHLNVQRDHAEAEQRRRAAEQASVEIHELSRPSSDPGRDERREWLYTEIMRMGRDFEETADLVLKRDYSHAEAAKRLGVPTGTVSRRIKTLEIVATG